MKRLTVVESLLALVLVLVACGSGGDQTPVIITVVASPTPEPPVITVVTSATPVTEVQHGEPTPAPTTEDVLPPAEPTAMIGEEAPGEAGFDAEAFWASFPLPPDAEVVPAVEGIDLAFTTDLAEPQVFDYYAAWLELHGWSRQAPTEAMITLPHQTWRKDVAELVIEIPGLDEAGRTLVWVRLTYLVTDALPAPTEQSVDVLPEPTAGSGDILPGAKAPTPITDQVPASNDKDWSSSGQGNAAGTRYNPTALSLPSQLLWEWGRGETDGPDALVAVEDWLYVLTNQGDLYVLDDQGREMARTILWAEGGRGPGTLVATGDAVVACISQWIAGRRPAYPARVVGVDRAGNRQWELEIPGEQGPCTLLADRGLVAVAPAGSGPEANWLSVRDAATGEERWRTATDQGNNVQPLASDGTTLYVAQPDLVAYDLLTGQVRWQQPDERLWSAAGAVSEGRLYVRTTLGSSLVLDAGSGQILHRGSVEAGFGTVLAHGHSYAARDGGLDALDATSGTLVWHWKAPAGTDVIYLAACQTHVLTVTWRAGAGREASILHLLDPASGEESDSWALTWWEPRPLSGGLAVAYGRIYALSDFLRSYGPGSGGLPELVTTPQPSPTVPPPSPTERIPPQPTLAPGAPVTGHYAEVWARMGGAGGRLGLPLASAVEDTFAEQHFERGLMHWGRWDLVGDPEREIQVIVYGTGGSNPRSGDLWGRFVDYWQEGDGEYSCPETAPPLGPRRGFGLVWCKYVRDSLGAPLEEEYGLPASYQDFQGGTLIWSPTDGGIYVLFNQGDWRFEAVK